MTPHRDPVSSPFAVTLHGHAHHRQRGESFRMVSAVVDTGPPKRMLGSSPLWVLGTAPRSQEAVRNLKSGQACRARVRLCATADMPLPFHAMPFFCYLLTRDCPCWPLSLSSTRV
jgi:hypothetical protein